MNSFCAFGVIGSADSRTASLRMKKWREALSIIAVQR